ncbi:hypothetical protein F4779DRAFT_384398 [Xylariaceae sp. FL0662B]|nr:hypothetical protein F4779DRAFT_384398 [Xylariaceae sp. FL0662B]
MHLLDLPSEVIVEILTYFVDERKRFGDNARPTLYAAALCCRRMSELVRDILPRRMRFEVCDTLLRDLFRMMNFNRACAEAVGADRSPGAAAAVRRVSLFWPLDPPFGESHDLVEFLRNVSATVVRLSLKIELPLSASGYSHYSPDRPCVPPILFSPGQFPSLRRMKMRLPEISSRKLLRLLQQPALREANLLMDVRHMGHDEATDGDDAVASPVLSINCRNSPIDTAALSYVLSRCTQLRQLTMLMPGRAADMSHLTFYSSSTPVYGLLGGCLVSEIQNALDSLRHVLEDLTITGHGIFWLNHDGSRLDLSRFSRLRTAFLDSALFFKDLEPSVSRLGVWALLPPSLERLRVGFTGISMRGLFWSAVKLKNANFKNSFSSIWDKKEDKNSVGWLEELAAHKHEDLPNLCSVDIAATEIHDDDRYWKIAVWDVSPRLKSMFRAQGIELSGRTRVPIEWEASTEIIEEPWD